MEKEQYLWSQEFTEVELTFDVKEKIDKNLVKFFATQDRLKVLYGDAILVEGDLHKPIVSDETYWYVSDGKLKFVLVKSKGAWWECVIKGHGKVDVGKIAESKTISDLGTLDPEERKIVQEMMYNQKLKSQGREAEDSQKNEILRKLAEKNPEIFGDKSKTETK